MTVVVHARERRRYWWSVAALAIALPAAIAVNSWDSFSEWRSRRASNPIAVERGTTQRYAGAEWQLTSMTRLRDGSPDAMIVVAEFEAAIEDAELLRKGPCKVILTDEKGRRWQPTFITGRAVRQARPDAAAKARCSALIQAEKGKMVTMAETFIVPEGATALVLTVSVSAAAPNYLVFK